MSNADNCPVCANKIDSKGTTRSSTDYCPFCRCEFASTSQKSLDEVTGYQVLRTVKLESPANVYEAVRDGERFFITLLSEDSHIYSAVARFAEAGDFDPYRSRQLAPHPNLIRTYPVEWNGKVAIAKMDPLDGQLLADLLLKIGPIDVADAVNIVLPCVRLSRDMGESAGAGEMKPTALWICGNEVKSTAFAGVMFGQFHSDDKLLAASSLSDLELRMEVITKFTHTDYRPPELDMHLYKTGRYTAQQFKIMNIYGLGALLFELLANHQVPSITIGEHLIKRMELRAAHELRPEAPPELSKIVHRMMASLPEERYQDYDEIIADLEALHMKSELFMRRTEPPADKVKMAAAQKRQWVARKRECDFRNIHWGITHDQICVAEADQLESVMPALVTVESEFRAQLLHTIYTFAMDDDRKICISACVSPWLTDFCIRQPTADLDRHQELMARIAGLDGAEMEAEVERFFRPDLQFSRQLDVQRLQETYALMKEMISLDFGSPEVDDGPLLDEVITVAHLVETEGLDEAEVLRHCLTSVWQNERTYVMLSIWPSVLGTRNIHARFMSKDHRHLFPK